MKRPCLFFSITMMMLIIGTVSGTVMTVDSGPWYETDTAWYDQAKADTVAGTFTNLRTGTYPGSTNVDPVDFLNDSTVYAAGPKLLYWLYFIPGETVANIETNNLLETKLVIDWSGVEYALAPDHVNWVGNSDTAWLKAGAMEDYDDGTNQGVVGQIRFSWNLASMGAETIEEHRDAVLAIQTLARGEVRYRTSTADDWQYEALQVNVVPEPATMALLGLGGLLLRKRK